MIRRQLLRLAAGTRWGCDDRRAGPGGTPLQVAALPWQRDAEGRVSILLVTSRTRQRWILPKGWPVKGYSLAESAAREAYEEAGVRGETAEQEIGVFRFEKQVGVAASSRPVLVFPLRVTMTLARWPEISQRSRAWLPQAAAAERIDLPAVRAIIEGFAPV